MSRAEETDRPAPADGAAMAARHIGAGDVDFVQVGTFRRKVMNDELYAHLIDTSSLK